MTVSVIIPTFNRARLLVEAVNSVLSQTYKDYEIVVVDDGSTDDTSQMLERVRGPIRYYYQDNRGLSAARNHGLRRSFGEYVLFLDSDDLLLPCSLEILVKALDENPTVGVVHSDGYVVDENGNRICDLHLYRRIPFEDTLDCFASCNPIIGIHSALYRRTALEALDGPFDEGLRAYEDWDLHIRLKTSGVRFTYVPEHTCCYRFHGGNMTAPKSASGDRNRQALLRLRGKVLNAPWFDGLSLEARSRFFSDFLIADLKADYARQEQVIAHPSFARLPPKERARLLYYLSVENLLNGAPWRQETEHLKEAAHLQPLGFRPRLLVLLSFFSQGLPLRFLRLRRLLRRIKPPDPVTRILRSKGVA